jgi:hypothetical protein
MSYAAFLERKRQLGGQHGFAPVWMPDFLFDFQSSLVEWATWKGRAALFCDCGMGKTPMQLVWAQNVVQHTNRPVLIVAPLAASTQTVREAAKFNIPCERSSTGQHSDEARIIVTNYERLHLFDASRYAGMVCDESSILKNFDGVTKATVTEFMRRLPYRLLCTATAAPNDYIELGTSSEALGEMGHVDMLGRFFKNDESSLAPMSHGAKWRFKPHAERPFWRWMSGWARAARKPSDVGPFRDDRMILPALNERIVTVDASRPMPGQLFITAARTLPEQRHERRATIQERCEAVEVAARGADKFVAWCHLNDEADLLEHLISGSNQVSGSMCDEVKVGLFDAFTTGQLRVLITKPKIGAFGLNWQHCANLSVFPSHSYEQYYQAVRRCWRYGQTRDVTVHVVTTKGEADVLGNLQRKAEAADRMFAFMTEEMMNATHGSD